VAPEILGGGRFTESADVYSFAMVAWEVLTHRLPFTGMNPVQIGLAVREQKLRPTLPDDCPAGFGALPISPRSPRRLRRAPLYLP